MPIQKICAECGKNFPCKPAETQRRFCARACRVAYEKTHGRIAARATPLKFQCRTCDADFEMKPAYVTVYRNKYGKDPMYCSVPCSAIGRKRDAETRNSFTCLHCGKAQPMRRGPDGYFYYEQKFCDRKCKADHQRARALARFRAGDYSRHIKRHGYVWISVPSLVTGKKHAVLEHRYVMEQHLGRALRPEETVHHKDGNRQHNDLANLELFASRHGPGQRVADQIGFAIEMLRLYPDFARAGGVEFRSVNPDQATNRGFEVILGALSMAA